MQEVELDEPRDPATDIAADPAEHAADDAAGRALGTGPGRRRGSGPTEGVAVRAPHPFVRRWWPVLTALAVAFALPAAAQSWLAPAQATDLVGVAGVLDPLDGPVEPMWTSAPEAANVIADVGGVLVGSGSAGSGSGFATARGLDVATARGLDAATGTVLWSVPLEPHPGWAASCAVTGGPAAGAHRAVLVCMVVDADTAREADGMTFYEPTRAHLAVLDPATGRVLRTLPAQPLDTFATIQSDVVVAASTSAGILVSRIDPRSGDPVWSDLHASEPGQTPAVNAVVQRLGSTLYVSASDRIWTLSATGRPGPEQGEGEGEANGGWFLQRHAGGHVLRWLNGLDGRTGGTDLETGTAITAAAGEAPAWGVDDGSVPGLLLMRGIGLIARDLATGDVRWQTPGPVDATLVLDGVVYSVGPAAVRAQDGATGKELWTRTTDPVAVGSLLTDGTSLLVAGPGVPSAAGSGSPDGSASIVALDPGDGSVRWTVPVPEPIQSLEAAAGHLLLRTASGTYTSYS